MNLIIQIQSTINKIVLYFLLENYANNKKEIIINKTFVYTYIINKTLFVFKTICLLYKLLFDITKYKKNTIIKFLKKRLKYCNIVGCIMFLRVYSTILKSIQLRIFIM